MDAQTLRAYCNSKPGTVEDLPFGPETLTFKVKGKIFALMSSDMNVSPLTINLKCDPTLALILRDTYSAVKPGYHMNKAHWNTVVIDGSIPDGAIYEMIDHSYSVVVKGLKKSERDALKKLGENS
jgi:predicted DNA-binding protein (MmcQ/YjbR family)